MENIGIIRCEKNENRCPLTGCFKALNGTQQGFKMYDDCNIAGVFTCRCPGDHIASLAAILKSKGVDTVHFVTCTFAKKTENGWDRSDGGFCDHIHELAKKVHEETGLPCVLGSAHLPKGYEPERIDQAG